MAVTHSVTPTTLQTLRCYVSVSVLRAVQPNPPGCYRTKRPRGILLVPFFTPFVTYVASLAQVWHSQQNPPRGQKVQELCNAFNCELRKKLGELVTCCLHSCTSQLRKTGKVLSEVFKAQERKEAAVPQAGAPAVPRLAEPRALQRTTPAPRAALQHGPAAPRSPAPTRSQNTGFVQRPHVGGLQQAARGQHSPADTDQEQWHVLSQGTLQGKARAPQRSVPSAQLLSSQPRLWHKHTSAERAPCALACETVSHHALPQVQLRRSLMSRLADGALTSLEALRNPLHTHRGEKRQVRFLLISPCLNPVLPSGVLTTRASPGSPGYQYWCGQTQLWSFPLPSSSSRLGDWQTLALPAAPQDVRDRRNGKLRPRHENTTTQIPYVGLSSMSRAQRAAHHPWQSGAEGTFYTNCA